MASSLRNQIPLTFTARGLSDAGDGSNVPQGAMRVLTNLIPNPHNTGQFICRPAGVVLTNFPGMDNPGMVSGMLVVGNVLYGLIATERNPFSDQPFAYDIAASAFISVDGITAANSPIRQPTTGEWEPPILAKVGTRIIVTHPGFLGSGGDYGVKFGWFDVSDFSLSTAGNLSEQMIFTGDTDTSLAPSKIVGLPPGALPGEANIGFTVVGAGVPANTTVTAVADVAVAFSGTTNGTTAVTALQVAGAPSTAGLFVGQIVQGADIPANTTIAAINRGAFSLTLSLAATGAGIVNEAMAALGHEVTLSSATTATADGVSFTMFDPTVITGNPVIAGVQPGLRVFGTGVPLGTTVVSTASTDARVLATLVAESNIAIVTFDPGTLSVGMTVSGIGIPEGTTLLSRGAFTGLASLVFSNAATFTGLSTLTFSGTQIKITSSVPATSLGVALTITGGTAAAPLWGAGDTAPIRLPDRPVGVEEMNGRAWFALGDDGIGFSDALLPCQITNATQFLVPGNGMAVTAMGSLKLASSQVPGNVTALLAFQGDSNILQITGDPTTNNLALADLDVATGTNAPLTIVSTTKGTFFVSPEGLRLFTPSGQVSDPIGQDGSGVVGPFLAVTNPPLPGAAPASRMCAAANGRTLRITAPNTDGTFSEYWYDISRGIWTGPHSSAAMQIDNWSNTFVLVPTTTARPELRRSDDVPNENSVYIEDGDDLLYEWETSLMPDSGQMAMNAIIESAIMVALMPGEQTQVNFLNEIRENLDGVAISGLVIPDGIWGQGLWQDTFLGPDQGVIRQRQLPWSRPLVFKQGRVNIRGLSSSTIVLGNLYLRYQVLGYMLEVAQIPPVVEGEDLFLLANDGATILRNNAAINLKVR